MELRNIKTFHRIAELESFTAAAEDLGYTQSAVTMQIQKLEQELGCILFERIGKRPSLTESGEIFLEHASSILTQMQLAEKAVKQSGSVSGSLKIAAAGSLISDFLPELMNMFLEKFPDVRLKVMTVSDIHLFDAIDKNFADILFFIERPIYSSKWVNIFDLPVSIKFVCRIGHPLTHRKRISISDIANMRLAVTEGGISYRMALEEALGNAGYLLEPSLESDDTSFIKNMVQAHDYVAYLPEYVVKSEIDHGSLVPLAIKDPASDISIQSVYHYAKVITPQMDAFIETLKMYVDDMLC